MAVEHVGTGHDRRAHDAMNEATGVECAAAVVGLLVPNGERT